MDKGPSEFLLANISQENTQPYRMMINRDGIKEEFKASEGEGYVTIGRSIFNKQGKAENDIVTPQGDRGVSRVHCKLIFEDGFRRRRIPNYFVQFLLVCRPSHLNQSVWQNLPEAVIFHIYSYLKKPRFFIVKDLASTSGTKIKVPLEGMLLQRKQLFCLGPEVTIRIAYIHPSKDCSELFESQQQALKIDDNVTENDLFSIKINPYLEITMRNNGIVTKYFACASLRNQTVAIGRYAENDIFIDNHTVSRAQCRLMYIDRQWYIKDGAEGQPSSNVTSLHLTKSKGYKSSYKFNNRCDMLLSNTSISLRYGQ